MIVTIDDVSWELTIDPPLTGGYDIIFCTVVGADGSLCRQSPAVPVSRREEDWDGDALCVSCAHGIGPRMAYLVSWSALLWLDELMVKDAGGLAPFVDRWGV